MARAYPVGPGMIPLGPQSPYAPPLKPPPGGFATVSTDPNQHLALGRTVQTFSALPTNGQYQQSVNLFTNSVGINQYDCGVNGCMWMITSIQGLQVARNANAAGGLTHLSQSEITNAVLGTGTNPPSFLSANRFSNLRARVSWNDGSALQRSIDVDIAGGISIQTFSRNLSVDIITPDESLLVIDGQSSNPAFGGVGADARLVFDTLVSARCAPVDSLGAYILSRSPQLTQWDVRINSTASREIPIPSGANTVRVSVGDAGTGQSVSAVAFVNALGEDIIALPGGAAQPEIAIPATATALRILTAAAAGDYRYQAIFKISP